ncbi:hypothetical protein BJX62DRAFT_226271 [Aspergillus germanicus]
MSELINILFSAKSACTNLNDQRPTSKTKGIPHLNGGYISKRSHTVEQLTRILDTQHVVHVRGTPASGKSVLMSLLKENLVRLGHRVYDIYAWEPLAVQQTDDDNAWTKLAEKLRVTFHTKQKLHRETVEGYLRGGAYLLVDEAQRTYSDTRFWNEIVKVRAHGQGYNLNICLFCSYGSPITGVRKEPVNFTPGTLAPSQRLSLTPHPDCQIGLFFSPAEFPDAVLRISEDPIFDGRFRFDEDALSYIFDITNGHPGATRSLISYVHGSYRSDLKHRVFETITEEMVIKSLRNDDRVFAALRHTPVWRSFPEAPLLQRLDICQTLRRIRAEKIIEVGDESDEKNPERLCYENGWLHKTTELRNRINVEIYVLPTRLHEKYIEWLFAESSRPLDDKYDTVRKLAVDTAEERSVSTADCRRPLEAAYQDEFYRAFTKVAGQHIFIVSEWSRTKAGRVDFMIPSKRWAVELLRDGDRLGEHIARFRPSGRYHDWIRDGHIVSWIIINCTDKLPESNPEPNLIHAVFHDDWRSLHIFDHDQRLIASFGLCH